MRETGGCHDPGRRGWLNTPDAAPDAVSSDPIAIFGAGRPSTRPAGRGRLRLSPDHEHPRVVIQDTPANP